MFVEFDILIYDWTQIYVHLGRLPLWDLSKKHPGVKKWLKYGHICHHLAKKDKQTSNQF